MTEGFKLIKGFLPYLDDAKILYFLSLFEIVWGFFNTYSLTAHCTSSPNSLAFIYHLYFNRREAKVSKLLEKQ